MCILLSRMLGYLTNINGDRYPVILKSDIRFIFLMISLKDITTFLKVKVKITRTARQQIDG